MFQHVLIEIEKHRAMPDWGCTMNEYSLQNASYAAVPQGHGMGCAVACVASRLGIDYARALDLFSDRAASWTRGYWCAEVVEALLRGGLVSRSFEFCEFGFRLESIQPGSIVFVGPCLRYPLGHYLLRSASGWMNPWSNFPQMIPVEASLEVELPSPPEFVIICG